MLFVPKCDMQIKEWFITWVVEVFLHVTAADCGPQRPRCSETSQQMGFYMSLGQSQPHYKQKG